VHHIIYVQRNGLYTF